MSKFDYVLVTGSLVDDKLLSAFEQAHKDSPFHGVELDKEKAIATISAFDYYATNGVAFLMAAYTPDKVVGLIAGTEHPYFKNVGQEMIWWVDKDHRKSKIGLQLLNFLEEWSASRGHKHLFMAHYNNEYKDVLTKMLDRNGFVPVEYSYMKEIK